MNNRIEEKNKNNTAKQWKVGVTEKGFNDLNQFLEKINMTSKRRIKSYDVLDYLLDQLTEKDIPKICERAYTGSDKVEVLLDKLNQQFPEKALSKDELLALMVENFHLSGKGKSLKANKEQLGEGEKALD
jgi:hypothetical protein